MSDHHDSNICIYRNSVVLLNMVFIRILQIKSHYSFQYIFVFIYNMIKYYTYPKNMLRL